MKRTSIGRKLVIVAGLAGLVCAADVGSSWAASAAVDASGTIVTPLTITAGNNLTFGSLAVDEGGGTLVMATNAALTPSAGIHPLTGTRTAGSFAIAGQGGASYSISLPGSVTLDGPSAASATASTFTTALVSGNSITAGATTLPGGGADTLLIGATLTIGATHPAGSYLGTVTATIDYN